LVRRELKEWLDTFNNVTIPALVKAGFKPNATNAREGLANLTKGLVTDIPNIYKTLDDEIKSEEYDVPVRIYIPSEEKELPVVLFFHGGGHMAGSVTVYDPICRKLANATNHIVVSVEYRLSPENPYPAGITDAYNAVKGVFTTLEQRELSFKRELSLVGDSGGAAVVTSVVMKAQFDETVDIKKQALIYPSVDYTMESESMKENGVGYLLAASKIAWYFDKYFQNGEDRVKASPLHNEFTKGLPESIVITAGYDPLRDEGFEYVAKLKEAGVNVEHHNLENMIHTYMMMEDLCKEECEFTYKKIADFLNK